MNKYFENIDFWNEKYSADHTPWDLGMVSPPVRQLAAEHFPKSGKVIIPGCGRGHEALFLGKLGFAVTAVDFAAAPIAHLKAQAAASGLELNLIHNDIFQLPQQYAGKFDVFLEQTCLCALNPDRWEDYEALAAGVLKPGGEFFGVFMEVDVQSPPPYNCPPDGIRALFHEERWNFQGMQWEPSNPDRPGPEYTIRFTRR